MSEELDNVELDEPEYVSGSVDENEEGTEVEAKPEVKEDFKPWKKEATKPETIPYNRFSEVVSEKNAYEKKVREYEEKLADYERVNTKVKQINSIDDLKIDDFDSFNDYQRALVDLTRKELKADMEREAEAVRIQNIEKNIMSEFSNRLTKAAERNPEVNDAADYIGQFAQHIPAQTRYSLLIDENSPEVMYEIATTPGLLEAIIKMNPLDATRKIAKMSAKYDNQPVPTPIPKQMPVQSRIPEAMQSSKPKIAGTPNVRASEGSGGARFSDKMSMSDYRKLRGNK